jgi:two-component system nitrogen regulation sensor histidine kinase GlnL
MTLQERTGSEQLATQQNFKGAALSMSRMSALLAHEIKNPLAGIKGAAQLLEMELPEAHHELSHMIVSETDRITSLLQRIENLSSDAPVRFETVNIHEVLDHCLKITSASFGRHLEIKRSYDPSLPDIQADREMLVQCFINLFKNASEATEEGDSLSLQTSYSLTRYVTTETSRKLIHLPLQIAIKDSGKGVSDELQAHIFEPFVSNKSGGSGLGLAMVASVIADHGGAIAMHSSPQGSCFTLNLPITQGYNDTASGDGAVL